MHEKTTIDHSEFGPDDYTYIGDKAVPCSFSNPRWQAEDLASKAAAGIAQRERTLREGNDLLARAKVFFKKRAEERAEAQRNTTSVKAAVVALDTRVTETNN